jgi:hypothetical protein
METSEHKNTQLASKRGSQVETEGKEMDEKVNQ